MTSAEFRRLSLAARNSLGRLTRQTMRLVKATYERAAEQVAREVALASISEALAGQSAITTQSLVSIHRQLEAAAADIARAIETQGTAGIRLSVEKIGTLNDTFLGEAFNRAGVTKVNRVTIAQIVSGLNEAVVRSVVNRIWQDGYTFSQRCWRAGQRFQDDIKNVLSAGLAQGRDALAIAQDIQIYTADGKVQLMQRYGELVRGTREFSKRIPKVVDYRAIRLVRTELYESLRDASVEQGKINPAATGLWDWVRQGSTDWGCDCPDYASGSPYTLDALPSTPHSNCLCAVVPRLENEAEFNDRLVAWADGAPDEKMDAWYRDVYLPTETAA